MCVSSGQVSYLIDFRKIFDENKSIRNWNQKMNLAYESVQTRSDIKRSGSCETVTQKPDLKIRSTRTNRSITPTVMKK